MSVVNPAELDPNAITPPNSSHVVETGFDVASILSLAHEMLTTDINTMRPDDIRRLAEFTIATIGENIELQRANTELQERNAELIEEAQTDHLTRLKTRGVLNDAFDYHGRKAAAEDLAFVSIFVDVNKLKTINDNFGHAIGDDYLLAATDGLLLWSGGNFDIIRWGGDEFSLVGTMPYHKDETTRQQAETGYKDGLRNVVTQSILDVYQPEQGEGWESLSKLQKAKYIAAGEMLGVSVGAVFVSPEEVGLVITELDAGRIDMGHIVELVHDEADRSMYRDKPRNNREVYEELARFSPFIIRGHRDRRSRHD